MNRLKNGGKCPEKEGEVSAKTGGSVLQKNAETRMK